jgi:peptidoglycan/LPS O-acetylase OafA/YrhL
MAYRRWAFIVVVVGLALNSPSANAGVRKHQNDPRLTAASIAVGVGTTAGFLALRDWRLHRRGRVNGIGPAGAAILTTGACLALSPIVGTIAVQRELTFREAYGLAADCVIPFIGSWLVDKAFDAHPEWEPAAALKHR